MNILCVIQKEIKKTLKIYLKFYLSSQSSSENWVKVYIKQIKVRKVLFIFLGELV